MLPLSKWEAFRLCFPTVFQDRKAAAIGAYLGMAQQFRCCWLAHATNNSSYRMEAAEADGSILYSDPFIVLCHNCSPMISASASTIFFVLIATGLVSEDSQYYEHF